MGRGFRFLSVYTVMYWCVVFLCHATDDGRSRDPFNKPIKKQRIKRTRDYSKQLCIEGIVSADSGYSALLRYGNDTEIVKVGDCIWGFSIIKVCQNEVVIKNTHKVFTLKIE